MGLSLYVVLIMYAQYKASPIIVTFATKTMPIHKIPFPAVTICPDSFSVTSKLNYSKLEDMIYAENFTADDMRLYDYANQICSSEMDLRLSNVSIIRNSTDFYKTIHEVSCCLDFE